MSNQSDDNKKSNAIENMLENFSMHFNTQRSSAFAKKVCVMCGGEAKHFKDAASEREYDISGMCQVCQDSFFE